MDNSYFEQFTGDVICEVQSLSEAIGILMNYPTVEDQRLLGAIQYIRRHPDKIVGDVLIEFVQEMLNKIKWNAHFIYGLPHDMNNPGVNADYALLELRKKWND